MNEGQRWINVIGAEGPTRNAARALEERRRAERRVDELVMRLGRRDGPAREPRPRAA